MGERRAASGREVLVDCLVDRGGIDPERAQERDREPVIGRIQAKYTGGARSTWTDSARPITRPTLFADVMRASDGEWTWLFPAPCLRRMGFPYGHPDIGFQPEDASGPAPPRRPSAFGDRRRRRVSGRHVRPAVAATQLHAHDRGDGQSDSGPTPRREPSAKQGAIENQCAH